MPFVWSPSSWERCFRAQKPAWHDEKLLENILKEIGSLPALVFAGETRALETKLKKAGRGEAFVLQCGSCSENFSDCNGIKIHNMLRAILQMSVILSFVGQIEVVKIGRIAGQYAKPRSSDFEIINGIKLPIYKGDMINSFAPNLEDRKHDPKRILEGYFRSAATLNLIRAFIKGGYASLEQMLDWQKHYFENYPVMKKYGKIAKEIIKAVNFMKILGINENNVNFNETNLFISHEALLLEYEEVMTRIDTTTGLYYDTSAHMLWVGNRTKSPKEAHVEFLKGINNPIGIKIGPDFDTYDVIEIIKKLNPENKLGKLCLIPRLGVNKIEQLLPKLINVIGKENLNIVWICDPMHGNTYKINNRKVRNFNDIYAEIELFWKIHKQEKTIPAGIHLELTGENVTECVGGSEMIKGEDLDKNYTSTCDPRLNSGQAVEFSFMVAKLLKSIHDK